MTGYDERSDGDFDHSAVEICIRLIDRLVADGTLTETDAAEIYARTVAGSCNPAERAANLRILDVIRARCRPR